LRYPDTNTVKLVTDKNESGIPVTPGKYFFEMFMSIYGDLTKIAAPQTFEAKFLNNTTLPAEDRATMVAFHKKVAELNRAVEGALNSVNDLKAKTDVLTYAIKRTLVAPNSFMDNFRKTKIETEEILQHLFQDRTLAPRNKPTYPTVYYRLNELAREFGVRPLHQQQHSRMFIKLRVKSLSRCWHN
jgi:hypothetical protein